MNNLTEQDRIRRMVQDQEYAEMMRRSRGARAEERERAYDPNQILDSFQAGKDKGAMKSGSRIAPYLGSSASIPAGSTFGGVGASSFVPSGAENTFAFGKGAGSLAMSNPYTAAALAGLSQTPGGKRYIGRPINKTLQFIKKPFKGLF